MTNKEQEIHQIVEKQRSWFLTAIGREDSGDKLPLFGLIDPDLSCVVHRYPSKNCFISSNRLAASPFLQDWPVNPIG